MSGYESAKCDIRQCVEVYCHFRGRYCGAIDRVSQATSKKSILAMEKVTGICQGSMSKEMNGRTDAIFFQCREWRNVQRGDGRKNARRKRAREETKYSG
jgi:hypothetical protein